MSLSKIKNATNADAKAPIEISFSVSSRLGFPDETGLLRTTAEMSMIIIYIQYCFQTSCILENKALKFIFKTSPSFSLHQPNPPGEQLLHHALLDLLVLGQFLFQLLYFTVHIRKNLRNRLLFFQIIWYVYNKVLKRG